MIKLTKKEECCGCTACYSACSMECIRIVPDDEGFEYPTVDSKIFIDCGLRERVN